MASIKQKLDNLFLGRLYSQLFRTINQETMDCQSLLDIGCGYKPEMKKITQRMSQSVGVDVFEPSIAKAKADNTHSQLIVADALLYLEKVADKSFDAVLALDLIEHLEKERGLWLMHQMERIARKKVLIFTPNGFVIQRPFDNNPWQEHKSGWEWKEMKEHGYGLYGIGGFKKIRGERYKIKYKPRIFWKYFSYFTQNFTYKKYPFLAFEILCVKDLAH
jgi:SAM-dependent methyltransferase